MTDAPATSPEFWVARCSPEHAAQAWPAARKHVEAALAKGDGFYLPEDVRDRVTAPDSGWSLWLLGADKKLLAAWVSVLTKFPRATTLDIPFASGTGLERWYRLALAATEQHARETGCDRLRCAGREGWSRRGYRRVATLFERTL